MRQPSDGTADDLFGPYQQRGADRSGLGLGRAGVPVGH
jgi:hypothetical protein